MDIQIPSNLERYLFELSGRDPGRVIAWQEELRTLQELRLDPIDRSKVERDFRAGWVDDLGIRSTMAKVYQSDGLLIDPHTAVAWTVGEDHRRDGHVQVVLAPADPIKFGAAVTEATGVEPALPAGAAHVLTDPERILTIANDFEALVKVLEN
jgi:threonine synthase